MTPTDLIRLLSDRAWIAWEDIPADEVGAVRAAVAAIVPAHSSPPLPVSPGSPVTAGEGEAPTRTPQAP